jgi:4-amino-4-deoxy-L-arabinose transferase-like glycosyltransferase
LLVFRALLHVDGGSPTAIRIAAAVIAALVVLATMALTARLAGRIPAILAGLLLATLGASPLIESFTLSGELLASLPAVLALLAVSGYLRGENWIWLVACGLLTGIAVMTKQSGFDAGLAAVLFLLASRRRAGIVPAGVIVGSAVVPVALGVVLSASPSDWWYAMVTYRGAGDSIVSGSLSGRLGQFWDTAPAMLQALAALGALAAVGWRRSPLLAKLWLGAAALCVIGGGNFHEHYYLQVAPPLALLGGIGLAEVVRRRSPFVAGVAAGLALWGLYATVPLWFDSPREQAAQVFPRDGHLQVDGEIVDYVRSNSRPGDRIFVMWAAANVYYLSDRDPAVPYMWFRNIQTIPGALDQVRDALAASDRPVLVVVEQPPKSIDPSGRTADLLNSLYEQVAVVGGVPIYKER